MLNKPHDDKLCLWCQIDGEPPSIHFNDRTGAVLIHSGCLQEMLWNLKQMILTLHKYEQKEH